MGAGLGFQAGGAGPRGRVLGSRLGGRGLGGGRPWGESTHLQDGVAGGDLVVQQSDVLALLDV